MSRLTIMFPPERQILLEFVVLEFPDPTWSSVHLLSSLMFVPYYSVYGCMWFLQLPLWPNVVNKRFLVFLWIKSMNAKGTSQNTDFIRQRKYCPEEEEETKTPKINFCGTSIALTRHGKVTSTSNRNKHGHQEEVGWDWRSEAGSGVCSPVILWR